MQEQIETVLTRDISSHRVHMRYRRRPKDPLMTFEGCNLDAAGAFTFLTQDELADIAPDDMCGRCFPNMGPSDD